MDRVSKKTRSANMRAIRSKGMKPEMIVRRLIYSMGYRYRLHRTDLPGKPDLVFLGRKKVIFVHGCFWHQHSDPSCKKAHTPQSNKSYWQPKLQRNQERDKAHISALEADGWGVLVLWECQLSDLREIETRIRNFLEAQHSLCT